MSTLENKSAGKARATPIRKVAAPSQARSQAPSSVHDAKAQFTRVAEKQFMAADDAAAFGKSNIDALIQAGTSFFRGWEEMTRSVVGLTQSQVETSMSAAKALLGAKTLSELTDLQKAYTRATFDNAVTEASRLSELAIRITNETVEPLNARMTATIEQISRPALAA